jgi:hypothetical protein
MQEMFKLQVTHRTLRLAGERRRRPIGPTRRLVGWVNSFTRDDGGETTSIRLNGRGRPKGLGTPAFLFVGSPGIDRRLYGCARRKSMSHRLEFCQAEFFDSVCCVCCKPFWCNPCESERMCFTMHACIHPTLTSGTTRRRQCPH